MRTKTLYPVTAVLGLTLHVVSAQAQESGASAELAPPAATAPAAPAAIPSLPAPPALPAPPPPPPLRGQVERGFALEGYIGTRLVVVDASGPQAVNPLTLGSLAGGISLGYKTGRVLLGVGFEYAALSTKTQSTTSGMSSTRATSAGSFLISPMFQVALVRSPDRRVELLAAFRIGFGRPFYDETREPATSPATDPYMGKTPLDLKYELAPGVRFWAHRHFAVTALIGASGYYSFVFTRAYTGVNPTSSSDSVGLNSLFVSLGALGVF